MLFRSLLSVKVKGNKHRKLVFPNETLSYVKKYIKVKEDLFGESEFLFPGRNSSMAINSRSVFRIVRKYGAELGITISPHTLRSSIATHIAALGGDAYAVQQQLGHAHIMTSESYVKVGKQLRDPLKFHPKDNKKLKKIKF